MIYHWGIRPFDDINEDQTLEFLRHMGALRRPVFPQTEWQHLARVSTCRLAGIFAASQGCSPETLSAAPLICLQTCHIWPSPPAASCRDDSGWPGATQDCRGADGRTEPRTFTLPLPSSSDCWHLAAANETRWSEWYLRAGNYTQPCCNEASALSSGLFTYTHHQPARAYATSESERGRSRHDASWSSQVAKVHIHIHIFSSVCFQLLPEFLKHVY